MLKKLENKKIFMFYLLGVLLLSTGVSFAYFSATTKTSGSGSMATGTTATIESKGVNAGDNISFSNIDIYPGHKAVASIEVTGTGDDTPMIYNIIFNGSNTFNTPINYTIYKTEENIEASYSCSVMNGYINGGKTYYEECSGNNIDQLGSAIVTGTITKGDGKTTLKTDEIILTVPEGKVVYYYIVFEYPNEDASQNDDIGSTISGNITIEEGSKYQAPNINLVASTVSGNNGWYKSADITANITTQTGNYDAKYCVTTEDSCTPNTDVVISENHFTTTLNSNSSSQKICIRVEDEYNQVAEGCSESYYVDTTNPTVTISSTSITENSITITVNGSDSHSGIAQYRFSSDNGNSYTDVNISDTSYTYTFSNLEKGTAYNISVQIIDEAGNVNTVTQEIETKNPYAAREYILAHYPTVLTRTNFSTTVTATTTGTIYKSANESQYDDNGEVYYFAGAPTDNYVKFAGFYWRIIRINGNGSIRLIYQGLSANATGAGTQISTSAYSERGNSVNFQDSAIKNVLDSWYQTNIANKNFADNVDDEIGFCNDRQVYRINATTIYYGSYRLQNAYAPSYKCSASDYIIKSGIGLLSADEISYAGGVYYTSNSNFYLFTNSMYWTMTPAATSSNGIGNLFINASSTYSLSTNDAYAERGVRPVINLKADTQFTGSGTTSDPYEVVS